MNDDLAEMAISSFEAKESADNEQNANAAQGSESAQDASNEQKDNNTADNAENASESELEGNNGNYDDDSDDKKEPEDEDTKETEGDSGKSDDDDNKKEDKREMTDEEFEKLAKERGYSKKSEQDAEKQRQRQDRDALANATKRPKEVDRETWDNMSSIKKVIYNQLPYITAIGKDGNVVKVKTPQQLPDEFEFANKKAELSFQSDMQEQTVRAEKANEQIMRQMNDMKAEQEKTATARAIIAEVESLQKSGDLPTPKAKYGTKEFDNDDAVVLTNKVLNYYQQRRANGDRMSIKDALILYKSMNPDEFKSKKEAKGDVERKEVAKKISGVNKSSDTSITKSSNRAKYYRPGMDVQDIVDRALEDMD